MAKVFDRVILCTNVSQGQGLAYYYYRAFCDELGKEKVWIIDDGSRSYNASIFERGINRFKYEIGWLSHQKYDRLTGLLTDGSNLVMLFNNAGLTLHEIQKLSVNRSVYLVNYLSDSPYGAIPSIRSEILKCISCFHLVCTFAQDLVPVLYQLGAQRVERISFGYCKYTHLEPTRDVFVEFPERVYYFGTWTPEIEEWLSYLTVFDLGIEGIGWENAKNETLREIGTRKMLNTDRDMPIMARKAGVVVNFTRAQHGCFHTMKTFELTAAGACVVSNFSREQAEFFADNHSMVYFNTSDEMVNQVRFFMNNTMEAKRIRECAIEDALPHSYHARVVQLLQVL